MIRDIVLKQSWPWQLSTLLLCSSSHLSASMAGKGCIALALCVKLALEAALALNLLKSCRITAARQLGIYGPEWASSER